MIKGVVWAIIIWIAVLGAMVAFDTDVGLWARTLYGAASSLAVILGVSLYDKR